MHKIVEVALKEVGYTENPANSNLNKFGKWIGMDGCAWCCAFVSWCYDQAGFNLGNIGLLKGFIGCQYAFAHWSKKKEFTLKPISGDIVLFDWNKDQRYDHTGIFIRDLGNGFFESVEGNTSASNQSNGGEVQVRTRRYDQAIFIHPKVLDKK